MKNQTYHDAFVSAESGDLCFFRSENLACRHGFSTRRGGVSVIAHLASLNLGTDRGDDDAAVSENRRRFAAAVGYAPERAVSAHQIHSASVITVPETDAGRNDFSCDGFVTRTPGLALIVKIADCVPILLCDSANGVIAALHAGWRGTVADIAGAGIAAMIKSGADPRTVYAAIGPCIHACCYEVGEEVADAVRAVTGEDSVRFLTDRGRGKYMADLPAINAFLLERVGVPADHISISDRCTCCESDLFFSHRALAGKRGVMAAAIVL